MRVLFALAFLCSSLAAAPPKLVIPQEVKPSGQYALVTPETDAVSVLYIGLDGLEPIPPQLLADKRVFALDTYGKPKGRYRFVAVGASATGEMARVDFALVIGDSPAPPNPNPPNPNPPAPGPKVEKMAVVIVEETMKRTPSQAAVIYDMAVRRYVSDKGGTVFVLDYDDPAVVSHGYKAHVDAAGVPCVLVFDASKLGERQKPVKAFRLPDSIAKFKEELEGVSK